MDPAISYEAKEMSETVSHCASHLKVVVPSLSTTSPSLEIMSRIFCPLEFPFFGAPLQGLGFEISSENDASLDIL